MQSRLIINSVLLLGCIGLALFLINTPDKKKETTTIPVSDINQNSINQIHIQRQGNPDIEFNKLRGQWLITSPLQITANPARINAMLRLLNVGSHTQLYSESVELKRFDLDPAQVVLKLNEHEFLFGNTETIDTRRYVMFNNTIHLVNDFLYHQLTLPVTFFVDLHLVPANQNIVGIKYADNNYLLHNGNWQSDTKNNINVELIDDMVNAWKETTALSISEASEFESDQFVELSLQNQVAPIKFTVIDDETGFILARPDLGIQYQLTQFDKSRLFPDFETSDNLNEELQPFE